MKAFTKAASAAAIAASMMSYAACADEAPQRLNDAWNSALVGEEPVLSPQQFAKLNNLAFQAAATRVCDGFELSQDKFTAALEDATTALTDDLTDDELAKRQTFILIEFGARYGLFLAEGEAQDKSFCTNAAELKAKPDLPNVWE